MSRTVISYDDITAPYVQPDPQPSSNSPSGPSQSKKRKWSNHKSGQSRANKNKNTANGNGKQVEEEAGDDEEDADSRYLTQEEIWDDSALIDAWDAAMEEGWKNEPVHKSPLWYNVPPTKPPNKKLKTEAAAAAANAVAGPSGVKTEGEESDSQPLDFDTFVPNYDASLALPAPLAPGAAPDAAYDYSTGTGAFPPPGVGVASQDEAFARALGAMYWGGYWTAVYHCHRSAQRAEADANVGGEDVLANSEDEDEAEDGAGAGGRKTRKTRTRSYLPKGDVPEC
ncbi:hypothetical protein MVEN_01945200 [Mycena venus]|uniref:Survival Motor Neuron Gemin2-binding domain-containing protein n=1 Tax=Mycena venus TaxID=2733690 RepID=A0A8H6XF30_9AGAR|nr:hypothetical protein MVEN_01945200 [Mycena venus]